MLVQITNGTYVCSAHFKAEDYRSQFGMCKRRDLKATAVPSVFSWSSDKPPRKAPKQRSITTIVSSNVSAAASAAPVASTSTAVVVDTVVETPILVESVFGDCDDNNDEASTAVVAPTCWPKGRDHDYADQPTTAQEKLEYARLYIDECEAKIAALEAERFGIDRFAGNNKMVKHE